MAREGKGTGKGAQEKGDRRGREGEKGEQEVEEFKEEEDGNGKGKENLRKE